MMLLHKSTSFDSYMCIVWPDENKFVFFAAEVSLQDTGAAPAVLAASLREGQPVRFVPNGLALANLPQLQDGKGTHAT